MQRSLQEVLYTHAVAMQASGVYSRVQPAARKWNKGWGGRQDGLLVVGVYEGGALLLVVGLGHPELAAVLHDVRQHGAPQEHRVLPTGRVLDPQLGGHGGQR